MILLLFSCKTIDINENYVFYDGYEDIRLPEQCTQETVMIEVDDNIKIEAVKITNEEAEYDVLFYPGNGGINKNYKRFFIELSKKMKVNILVPNYRGYGLSEGEPSIENLKNDAEFQYNYFIRNARLGRTILIGYSLGTYCSVEIASEHRFDYVVLIAPLSSMDEIIEYRSKKLIPAIAKPFIKLNIKQEMYELNNTESIMKIFDDLLIIDAEKDENLPSTMGKELYNLSMSKRKKEITIKNEDHYLLETNDKVGKVIDEIVQFIE
jgi:uncharacterized protein